MRNKQMHITVTIFLLAVLAGSQTTYAFPGVKTTRGSGKHKNKLKVEIDIGMADPDVNDFHLPNHHRNKLPTSHNVTAKGTSAGKKIEWNASVGDNGYINVCGNNAITKGKSTFIIDLGEGAKWSDRIKRSDVVILTTDGDPNEKTGVIDHNYPINHLPYVCLTDPPDSERGVDKRATLWWWFGDEHGTYDVYLGSNFHDVNNADNSLPPGTSVYKGRFDVNSYDPCGLEPCTAYYWRIDEVNGPNTWRGDVWKFTTCHADLNWDNITNLEDYADLVLFWSQTCDDSYPDEDDPYPYCCDVDIFPRGGNGIVDGNDLALLANNWLENHGESTPWFECWECDTQCHGNADCSGGTFAVTVADLDILRTAYGTKHGDPKYDPCADFDRDLDVDEDDETELMKWYNQVGIPHDCPTSR